MPTNPAVAATGNRPPVSGHAAFVRRETLTNAGINVLLATLVV